MIAVSGHRHGHRTRSLTGTFGTTEIKVPRARLTGPDGKTTEWKSKVLRTYQRRTLTAATQYPGFDDRAFAELAQQLTAEIVHAVVERDVC